MERKRGGARFEEVCLKLEKKHYRVINAVCGGDQRKIGRVIRALVAEAIKGKQVSDLMELAGTTPRRRKKEEPVARPEAE